MIYDPDMTESIQRTSLANQVVEILTAAIHRQEWKDRLPGERSLCERYQVSRPTMRSALAILKRRGFIRIVPRHSSRILAHHGKRTVQPAPRAIGLVLGLPFQNIPHWNLQFIGMLEQHLNAAGYTWAVHTLAHSPHRSAESDATNLIAANPLACWALAFVSRDIQRHCVKTGLPTLVLGSCYPGIRLPSFDIAYQAVGRHSAATLLRLGHRRVVWTCPQPAFGGDLLAEQGFIEALHTASIPDITPIIVHHAEAPEELQQAIHKHWNQPAPPTAVVATSPRHALTLAGILLQQGLHIPRDVSIICLRDDAFLSYCVPPFARYTADPDRAAKRCTRALIQLASAGALRSPQIRVDAQFIEGGTLAPARTTA